MLLLSDMFDVHPTSFRNAVDGPWSQKQIQEVDVEHPAGVAKNGNLIAKKM